MIAIATSALTMMLLVAIAGIVYPFKPFKNRKTALASAFGTFVLFSGLVSYDDASGKRNLTAANQTTSNSTSNEDVVELTGNSAGANSPTAIPASKAEARANSEDTSTSQSASQLEADQQPVQSASTQKTELSEADLRMVRKSFELLKWHETAISFRRWHKNGYELEAIAQEIEDQTLKIVRPLPASEVEKNLAGYELLAAIRPENATYTQKVTHYSNRKKQARQAAVARLRRSEDKVEGITWYHHPNEPKHINSRSTAYLYVGQRGKTGRPWLRLKVQYTASSWLFVENVIAWHDGIKEPLISGRFERDNNSTIWEWQDVSPTGYQLEVLRSLATAKEAILRFEGLQYRKDVTLSARDKKAIREVLIAYEVMSTGS